MVIKEIILVILHVKERHAIQNNEDEVLEILDRRIAITLTVTIADFGSALGRHASSSSPAGHCN